MPEQQLSVVTWEDLKRHLGKVTKPARYTGGEIDAVAKDPRLVDVVFALAFPDIYEVGMSHVGSQILYSILNDRQDVSCERVYAPWLDMENLLREQQWPLFTLENRLSLSSVDIVGFSLQYELTYTNVLMMLDLGNIPLRTEHRTQNHPLVIAGGPCAMAAEPMADFIDAFALGDGEELVLDIVNIYKTWKAIKSSRLELLVMLSLLDGVYVPSLYDVKYNDDQTIAKVFPRPIQLEPKFYERLKSRTADLTLKHSCFPPESLGWFMAPPIISRRVVSSLDDTDYFEKAVIPLIEPIHDRVMVEIFRGCTQGCRFCQAGTIYRPVRERSPETIMSYAKKLLKASGHDEVSLVSLSSADYSHIETLISRLKSDLPDAKISLPSLRVDSFSVRLARMLGSSRTGLTLAPEAGSQRMRNVINKKVTETEIFKAARHAFASGFSHIKLYFMIGLPGETDEDIVAISELVKHIRQIGRDHKARPNITVSVAGFVPKPNTPFQWEPCICSDELKRRQAILKRGLRGPGIKYKYHDADITWLEAIFARGDRRLSGALEQAYEKGARFDAWNEHFDKTLWEQTFHDVGLNADFYAHRIRDVRESLPWDHLNVGVSKSYLILEKRRAQKAVITHDCRTSRCVNCGVCPNLGVEMVLK